MIKKKYLLCIVFVCLMAITGVSVYGDEYNGAIENAISILSDLNSSNAFSVEMSGGSSTEIIVMPVNIAITVPLTFAINIFCEDPSCVDLAYSYIFDESGSVFDFTSQYTYIFDDDGSGFEAYSDDIDFEEFLALLIEGIFGLEGLETDDYETLFLDSFGFIEGIDSTYNISDLISTRDGVDIGALSDQYVELYNKYGGNELRFRR